MKYYAVRKGRIPGIYTSWTECEEQVKGFPGAIYKKFDTSAQAHAFLQEEASVSQTMDLHDLPEDTMVCYVDGSYNLSEKKFGYGIVAFTTEGREEYFGSSTDDYSTHRNVAGEVLAASEAMRLADRAKKKELWIYYDYEGIAQWAKGAWKANLILTKEYQALAQEMRKRMHLHFVKVKAHTGDQWNEVADRLAKKGSGLYEEQDF